MYGLRHAHIFATAADISIHPTLALFAPLKTAYSLKHRVKIKPASLLARPIKMVSEKAKEEFLKSTIMLPVELARQKLAMDQTKHVENYIQKTITF